MKIISLSEMLKLDKTSNITVNCESSLFYQLHHECKRTIEISQVIKNFSRMQIPQSIPTGMKG